MEQARLLIEQAEALGEPPEDPLLLFSVLYGFWLRNLELQWRCGARPCGAVSGARGEAEGDHSAHGRASPHGLFIAVHGRYSWTAESHFDQALALYDAAEHRSLATRFGQDVRVSILCFGRIALWMLGYPEAALADADQASKTRAKSATPRR